MADLTWYSREGADQRFLTRIEAGNLASKLDVTQGDAALGEMCIRDRRLGFYHFARPGDAAAQARYFVSAVGALRAKATLWLDWEANAVAQGPGWAKQFLDTVRSLTGSTPGIYMNGSALNGYDWSAVAREYPLWYAGGPNYSDYGSSYSDPAVPNVSYWGQPLIHQYTCLLYTSRCV